MYIVIERYITNTLMQKRQATVYHFKGVFVAQRDGSFEYHNICLSLYVYVSL